VRNAGRLVLSELTRSPSVVQPYRAGDDSTARDDCSGRAGTTRDDSP
jgi:hypothetical protein